MFTSRAEFRLSLRADNADERLTPLAMELGIASDERRRRFDRRQEGIGRAKVLLRNLSLTPNEARRHGLMLNLDGVRRSAYELLAMEGVDTTRLTSVWPELAAIDLISAEAVETDAKYAVYLERLRIEADALRREEARAIPSDIDFALVPGLSNELRSKLALRRPSSLAEAERIDGMTPAALAIIVSHLKRATDLRGAA